MLTRIAALLVLPAALLGQQAQKDSLNSALVWHDSVSFFFTPPTGWQFNSKDGENEGALAVLYRTGESWSTGAAVMYAAMFNTPCAGQAALAKRVAVDVSEWRRKASDEAVVELPSIIVEGRTVLLRKFVSPSQGAYEAVAYYCQPGGVPVLALSARSDSAYRHAYADFLKLAQSYGKGPKVKNKARSV